MKLSIPALVLGLPLAAALAFAACTGNKPTSDGGSGASASGAGATPSATSGTAGTSAGAGAPAGGSAPVAGAGGDGGNGANGGAPVVAGAGGASSAGASGTTSGGGNAGTSGAAGAGGGGSAGALTLFFVDTEGGQATVLHLPNGQILVVDTGNPGARDRDRILRVVRTELGADRIDYLWITHYHSDHVGGAAGLAAAVAIGQYIDHGDRTYEGTNAPADYLALARAGQRRIVAAGDLVEIGEVSLRVVASAGVVLSGAVPGGGQSNAFCQGATPTLSGDDPDENLFSAGFVLSFGTFQFLNLGDLLWSLEHSLVCPTNKLGVVDLYLTTHHGLTRSGAPQLVRAIQPLAAIMNNGPRKGGGGTSWDTLALAPGGMDVFQLHRALAADSAHNAPEAQIANLEEGAGDAAHYLKVVVEPLGRFTITNGRTGATKSYQSR